MLYNIWQDTIHTTCMPQYLPTAKPCMRTFYLAIGYTFYEFIKSPVNGSCSKHFNLIFKESIYGPGKQQGKIRHKFII